MSTTQLYEVMQKFPKLKMASKRGKKAHGCLSCSSKRSSPSSMNNRPKKLRQWNDDAMKHAYDAVTDGKMGVNRATLVQYLMCHALH